MMQQQNYISRLDFAKFLDVMPSVMADFKQEWMYICGVILGK